MKNFPRATLMTALLLSFIVISCHKKEIEETKFEYASLDDLYEYNKSKITISQGISGTLVMKEGNCMPSPGGGGHCTTFPIERTIKVFEFTTSDNVKGYRPLYEEIHSKLIKETKSDIYGFFQLNLSAGEYSVFVFEKDKYYANSSNGAGGINPIIIQGDSILNQNLRIDYAVY